MPLLQPDVLSRAEALGLAARRIVEGLRVGDHKSPFRGFSVEFVQHREYTPGDDIRHIDWKSYARSDRYTIKQYEQETNFVAHLLVDTSDSMRYGSGAAEKLAYAKLVAASLAYLVVRQRDSVSLRLFDHEWRQQLPASSQTGHISAVCNTLEAAAPGEKSGLGPLLESLADQVTRRGLVFLISDCFDDVSAMLKGLRHLRYRGHDVLVCHILHPDEIDFPLDGNVRFVDLEGVGTDLLARPHLVRPAYQRAVNAYLKQFTRGCEAARADYLQLRTDRPLGPALAAYLVDRSRRGMSK